MTVTLLNTTVKVSNVNDLGVQLDSQLTMADHNVSFSYDS